MFVFHEADAFKKKQKAEKSKGCDSRKIRYCGSVVTIIWEDSSTLWFTLAGSFGEFDEFHPGSVVLELKKIGF